MQYVATFTVQHTTPVLFRELQTVRYLVYISPLIIFSFQFSTNITNLYHDKIHVYIIPILFYSQGSTDM